MSSRSPLRTSPPRAERRCPPRTNRNESAVEKLDRNWMELLQELRVLQTGVQILAGFLLTLPFQSRFETLDESPRPRCTSPTWHWLH